MRYGKIILVALGCTALSACAPDHVMFVTDTSLGINVETKPTPTASVAFDRTEGYIAPSYANGALPPVVASLHIDGQSLLSPYVKQVYATGPAAVIVSGGPGPSQIGSGGPSQSTPTLTDARNRWAFVGTSTSVGVKISFDTTTSTPPPPIPESFLFGYRRKEISILPVGSQNGVDSYPSVIASVNSTAGAGGGPAGSTFQHSQFIATGVAADWLARNPEVKGAFSSEAGASVTASLSPEARAAAAAQGVKLAQDNNQNIDKVIAAVQTGGAFDSAKVKALVEKANTGGAFTGNTVDAIEGTTSNDELKSFLGESPNITKLLADAAS